MLRLVPEGDGLRAETLWTAPVLRGTYVIPVYHDGFLYGMSGRVTLTCVDAATGALRWRSREPGDGFPLLVGDDLLVLTKERTLHVGKASPEGWTERARLELFKDVVWSPRASRRCRLPQPGARVRARPGRKSEAPATAGRARVGGRALPRRALSADKPAAVDRFLASLPAVEWPDGRLPLSRTGDRRAGGATNEDRREDPMARPGTDLFCGGGARARRASTATSCATSKAFPDPDPWRSPTPRLDRAVPG
jgi:hypothetical protein